MRKFLFTKVWQREMLHNRGQFCQRKFLHMTKKFFRRKFSFHLFFQKKKKTFTLSFLSNRTKGYSCRKIIPFIKNYKSNLL